MPDNCALKIEHPTDHRRIVKDPLHCALRRVRTRILSSRQGGPSSTVSQRHPLSRLRRYMVGNCTFVTSWRQGNQRAHRLDWRDRRQERGGWTGGPGIELSHPSAGLCRKSRVSPLFLVKGTVASLPG